MNTRPKPNVIICTDGGGDIDDFLSLQAFMKDRRILAITTTHIEPEEKARMVKLITVKSGINIPVYAGEGFTRKQPNADFLRVNPLFNPAYGLPNPDEAKKAWYPMHGLAYKESYGDEFDKLQIEKESAAEAMVHYARQFTPEDKLVIVALGPLHNVERALRIDKTIASNIKLYSMGGLYPKGYNWLTAPATTQFVISQIETICVTSKFVVDNHFYVTPEQLANIVNKTSSKLGKTILKDWNNWLKGRLEQYSNTHLYDPTTLMIALNPECIEKFERIHVGFPCVDESGQIKVSLKDAWFSKVGLENQITTAVKSETSKVSFVTKVKNPEKLREELVDRLTNAFITHKDPVPSIVSAPNTLFAKPVIQNIISHKQKIVTLIQNARSHFNGVTQDKVKNLASGIKVYSECLNNVTYCVLGISKDKQNTLDYKQARLDIAKELELQKVTQFSQIIGDSTPFSKAGSEKCKKYLENKIDKSIILYGYTGNQSSDHCVDTNQAINQWIDENPEKRAYIIANVVDESTVTAIEKWGCSISTRVNNFFLVYSNEAKPSVKFGEDIISDGLTNFKAVAFDGGLQTFSQLITLLNNGITIEGFYNLRTNNQIDSKSEQVKFSALEYLEFIKNKIQSIKNVSLLEVKQRHDEYFKTHSGVDSQQIYELLTKNNTWEKLHLILHTAQDNSSKNMLCKI